MNFNEAFQWKCHPKAEALLLELLNQCLQANPFIAQLSKELHEKTSTRLFDWIDHFIVEQSSELEKSLLETGFLLDFTASSYRILHHPGAQLPAILLQDQSSPLTGIAVTVDRIADFLMVRGMGGAIEGSPFSPFRRCLISSEENSSLWVVERRGSQSLEPVYDSQLIQLYLQASEKWHRRPRNLRDEDESMELTLTWAQELVNLIGTNLAAWVVLECERSYWQARNGAAQIQKNRQDRLGMGWANHDHHTFRSSRKRFSQLVRLFEILGFHCRERFYAGEEAGWGAQVMENSACKLILFLDVDLAPHELQIDFAHHPLPELDHLGTIGLWCALHGDSILRAGMHHLEAQFLFDELKEDLSHHGVRLMDPFSSFSYLKQAFTAGEIWHVESYRLELLLKQGKITKEESEKFANYGAVGSHLENLQRREGYKGFNQKNVSFIIKETDPRTIATSGKS